MRRLFITLLVTGVIGLFSFTNPQRAALLSLFEDAGVIKLIKLDFVDDDLIKEPISLTLFKNHLIIPDYSNSNKFLTVVDLKDKTIHHQISKGIGSKHFLSPRSIRKDYTNNSLFVFDDLLRKIVFYDLEDSKLKLKKVRKKVYKKKEDLPGQVVRIDSSRILFDGIFKGRDEKYKIRDLDSGVSSYFGKHSDFEGSEALVSGECFMAMQGTIAVRPDCKMAVCASVFGTSVDFIDLGKELVKVNRKEFNVPEVKFLSPKYRKRFPVRPFRLAKGALKGFLDVKVTQNHVYLLFSGNEVIPCGSNLDETCKKNRKKAVLLQFDWHGKPLKKWKFKRDIKRFAINPGTNYIYVMENDNTLLEGMIE